MALVIRACPDEDSARNIGVTMSTQSNPTVNAAREWGGTVTGVAMVYVFATLIAVDALRYFLRRHSRAQMRADARDSSLIAASDALAVAVVQARNRRPRA